MPQQEIPEQHTEDQAAGRAALLIIDMINTLDFEGADALLPYAQAAADRIAVLRDAAEEAGVPVIYVNDNYGQWHSDRNRIIDHCAQTNPQARALIDRIRPRHDDY